MRFLNHLLLHKLRRTAPFCVRFQFLIQTASQHTHGLAEELHVPLREAPRLHADLGHTARARERPRPLRLPPAAVLRPRDYLTAAPHHLNRTRESTLLLADSSAAGVPPAQHGTRQTPRNAAPGTSAGGKGTRPAPLRLTPPQGRGCARLRPPVCLYEYHSSFGMFAFSSYFKFFLFGSLNLSTTCSYIMRLLFW